MKKLTLAFLLTGISWSAVAQNIILVAPTGGDFSDPVSALEAIGTALPAANSGNRYLVKIAPGKYLVPSSVVMQPYVDLEGSGTKTTLLRGQIGSSFSAPEDLQGIINAASHSEIRNLTVRNTWSASSAIGVLVNGTSGSALGNVRAVSAGGAVDSAAWKYGVVVYDSRNTRLTRVVARGKTDDSTLCQGLAAYNSTASVSESRLVGKGGCSIGIGLLVNRGSTVDVYGSLMSGEGNLNSISATSGADDAGEVSITTIRHSILHGNIIEGTPFESGISETRISHSELYGSISGTPSCFSVHDPLLVPLTAACTP